MVISDLIIPVRENQFPNLSKTCEIILQGKGCRPNRL